MYGDVTVKKYVNHNKGTLTIDLTTGSQDFTTEEQTIFYMTLNYMKDWGSVPDYITGKNSDGTFLDLDKDGYYDVYISDYYKKFYVLKQSSIKGESKSVFLDGDAAILLAEDESESDFYGTLTFAFPDDPDSVGTIASKLPPNPLINRNKGVLNIDLTKGSFKPSDEEENCLSETFQYINHTKANPEYDVETLIGITFYDFDRDGTYDVYFDEEDGCYWVLQGSSIKGSSWKVSLDDYIIGDKEHDASASDFYEGFNVVFPTNPETVGKTPDNMPRTDFCAGDLLVDISYGSMQIENELINAFTNTVGVRSDKISIKDVAPGLLELDLDKDGNYDVQFNYGVFHPLKTNSLDSSVTFELTDEEAAMLQSTKSLFYKKITFILPKPGTVSYNKGRKIFQLENYTDKIVLKDEDADAFGYTMFFGLSNFEKKIDFNRVYEGEYEFDLDKDGIAKRFAKIYGNNCP